MRWAIAFVALVFGLGALGCFAGAVLAPGGSSAAPAAAGDLACSVKAAVPGCDTGAGEVAVFRMSSTSNAHAGTPGGSAYGNVVCCGGVTGLDDNCSGTYDTVLRLSGTDNAHVQSTGSYSTAVCLSTGSEAVDCTFAGACDPEYACLATASGADNAHVADCNVVDYPTKVCCYVGAEPTPEAAPVGGLAEYPPVTDSSGPNYVALAGGFAGAALALAAGAWYVRRWLGTRG